MDRVLPAPSSPWGRADLPGRSSCGRCFSVGAIYARDPYGRLDEHQLNGGRHAVPTEEEWALIQPCPEENERLFGIPVETLLTWTGGGARRTTSTARWNPAS